MYHDNHEILYHDISYITIIMASLIYILCIQAYIHACVLHRNSIAFSVFYIMYYCAILQIIDSQKQTNEELENTIKELQEKIILLNQRIEELLNENKVAKRSFQ